MGKRHLIDTNTIIDYLRELYPQKVLKTLDKIVDEGINISVINKIEVLSFLPKNKKEQEEFEIVTEFIKFANVYPLNDEIVELTIEIRKKYKTKLPDAVIAATASYHNFILITNNTKDFKKIKGLIVINSLGLAFK